MEKNVKQTIDRLLAEAGEVRAGALAKALRVTRQAAHAHLRRAVEEGWLERLGAGRGSRYRRAGAVSLTRSYPRAGLDEDAVYRELVREPALAGLARERAAIFRYALTEMVNNAIDHSDGETVEVQVAFDPALLAFDVRDDGIGIWRRLRGRLGLPTAHEALEELSKGKRTTMPAEHTGEGIFFTSKVGDRFSVDSDGLQWLVDNVREDMAVGDTPSPGGTRVRFELGLRPRRRLEEVFREYAPDHTFDRTRTVVKLFEHGTDFVSRSEAKRLLRGLEAFREVVVDFHRVERVGQGFVDEVFRVFAAAHPETALLPVNASPAVRFMLDRTLLAR